MKKSAILLATLLIAVTAITSNSAEKLTLEDCIRLARQNNPAIYASKYASTSASYKKKAAVATFLPVFKAEYAHTWLDEIPTFQIPAQPGMTIPGGTQNVTIDLSSIGMPPVTVPVTFPDTKIPGSGPTQLPAGDDEQDSLTISVTQPLFAGGAIWQGYNLAKLQEKIAALQADDTNQEITYRTRTTFYNVLKAREFVRVAEKAVEMGESLRKRAKAFFDVGMIAKNDYLEAEVNVAQFQQNLTTARTGYDLARTGLGLLIGRPEGELVEVEGELRVATVELSLEECIQNGLHDRPDVRIAQMQVEMSQRAVKLEGSQLVPQVALVGQYQHSTGSFTSDTDIMSLTIGATWTFWEWGRKYHNIRSAQYTSKAAEENLRLTKDTAILEIKEAYLKIEQALKNIATAVASLSSAAENLRVVQARYDQQMATSFDVLKAQTLFTQAQTNEISARADYLIAMAELDRAMGYVTGPIETTPQPTGVTQPTGAAEPASTTEPASTAEPAGTTGEDNSDEPAEPGESDDNGEPAGSI